MYIDNIIPDLLCLLVVRSLLRQPTKHHPPRWCVYCPHPSKLKRESRTALKKVVMDWTVPPACLPARLPVAVPCCSPRKRPYCTALYKFFHGCLLQKVPSLRRVLFRLVSAFSWRPAFSCRKWRPPPYACWPPPPFWPDLAARP